MIIGVYGISRVGKDYFISHIISNYNKAAKHIKGSYNLNRIANEKYNTDFKSLNNEERIIIRKLFTSFVKREEEQAKIIFVDGHYSFPINNEEFEEVITQDDIDLYDVFICLDRSSESIYLNSLSDNKHYSDYLLDVNNIDKWKKFDKFGLKRVVNLNHKKWIVINDFYDYTDDFFNDFLSNYSIYDTLNSVKNIINDLEINKKLKREVILLDCDKTLSIDDMTTQVVEKAGLDMKTLKSIFSGDDYTDYQFYNLQKYITSSEKYLNAITKIDKKSEMNSHLLQDLKNCGNVTKIALTTGLADMWYEINSVNMIFDYLIGKGINNNYFNYYVTPRFKELFAKELVNRNYIVTAVGDSLIDVPMLESANKGILVAMKKLDKRVIRYLTENTDSKIKQFSYNAFRYENIEEVEKL